MRADSESGAVKVGDQALFVIHRLERRGGIGLVLIFQQGAGSADGPFDLPESIAAVDAELRVSSFRFRAWADSIRFSRNLKL
jgi:hypothetical protein